MSQAAGLRFAPPRVTLPAELSWLLGAAFGPELPPAAGVPGVVSELARRFDLEPRIVARHGAADLEARLGPASGDMIRAHRRAVALTLAVERTAQQVARRATRHGLPIVFLKGYALQLVAPGPAGWRLFVDLDVLLSRRAAAELRELLVADGWRTAEEADNPQHLPPIQAPNGTPVDIHFRLRGIKAAADRWASADELLNAGLCRPAGLAAGAWVPRAPLMAAHIAAHALEQHGHRPGTYPLLRAVADITDLITATGEEGLAAQAAPFVSESLAEDELQALFTLGRILGEGRTPAAENDEERWAAALLQHIVAGTLDPVYRQGLAIDHTAGRLRQARRDGVLMRYIARKLQAPTDQLVAGAGEPVKGMGSVRRRLFYPFRLGSRFAAAAAARLRRAFDR